MIGTRLLRKVLQYLQQEEDIKNIKLRKAAEWIGEMDNKEFL